MKLIELLNMQSDSDYRVSHKIEKSRFWDELQKSIRAGEPVIRWPKALARHDPLFELEACRLLGGEQVLLAVLIQVFPDEFNDGGHASIGIEVPAALIDEFNVKAFQAWKRAQQLGAIEEINREIDELNEERNRYVS